MKSIKNVTVSYIYSFVASFDFTDAIWVLYLAFRGMSLFEIGLLEGIFHITSLLFEMPTGAIADTFGRKRAIILGRISAITSALLLFFGRNFFVFALAMIFSAVSFNLNSGSDDALVYDSLKKQGLEEKFLKINGRRGFLLNLGCALGSLVGGIISDSHFDILYLFVCGARAVALIVSLFFDEVEASEKEERVTVLQTIKTAVQILKENREVLRLSIYSALTSTLYMTVFFYSQEYYSSRGLQTSRIAIILLFGGIAAALGSLACDKLAKLLKGHFILFCSVLIALSIIAFFFGSLPIIIAGTLVTEFFSSALYYYLLNGVNELIPSEQRATLISFESMVYSVFMIAIFPFAGWLCDIFSMSTVFGTMGLFLLAAYFVFALSAPKTQIRTK